MPLHGVGPSAPPISRSDWTLRLILGARGFFFVAMAAFVLLVSVAGFTEIAAGEDNARIAAFAALVFAHGLLLFDYALCDIHQSRGSSGGYRLLKSPRVRLAATCALSAFFYFFLLAEEPFPTLESLTDEDQWAVAVIWVAFLGLLGYSSSELKKLRSRAESAEFTAELPLMTRAGDWVTADVVMRLRERAARMNLLSLLTLALIGAVLILGYRLFTDAEQAATQKVNIPELRQQLANKSGELERLHTQWFSAVQAGALVKAEVVADLAAKRETLKVTVEGLREDIQRAIAGQSEPGANRDQPWRYALSLLSTKIGAVALLIFGVQILVSLHYYTARLASTYESRADYLQLLSAKDIQDCKTLKDALLPAQAAEQPIPALATDPNLPKLVAEVVSGGDRKPSSPA